MTPEQYKTASAAMYLHVIKNLVTVTLDALKWFGDGQCAGRIAELEGLLEGVRDIEAINETEDTIEFVKAVRPQIQKLIIPNIDE